MRNLSEYINIKSENLSFIKFLAAIMVIFGHSFPLSQYNKIYDFIDVFSKKSVSFGSLAVAVFFISSGFLLTRSIDKKRNVRQYLKARVIRIFPPLMITVILTVLFCGFFLTHLSIIGYFTNIQTYKYLLNALLIPIHSLPGVFLNNPYGNTVNGSLWTLPVEFSCYLLLLAIFKLNLLNQRAYKYSLIFVVVSYFMIFSINISFFKLLSGYIQPVYAFIAGSYFYMFRDKIFFSKRTFVLSIFLFIALLFFGLGNYASVTVFPYILLYMSFGLKQCAKSIGNFGKLSYGIYLCAFPIQQTLVYFNNGEMNVYLLFVLSSIISIFIGYIIYYLGEKNIKLS